VISLKFHSKMLLAFNELQFDNCITISFIISVLISSNQIMKAIRVFLSILLAGIIVEALPFGNKDILQATNAALTEMFLNRDWQSSALRWSIGKRIQNCEPSLQSFPYPDSQSIVEDGTLFNAILK
jgi:hypothetical protein